MALTKEHLVKNFREAAARLGFHPTEFTFDMSHPAFEKNLVVLGSDPAEADIIGKVVTVNSIGELRALSGVPDAPVDDHVTYPELLKDVLKHKPSADFVAGAAGSGRTDVLDKNITVAASAYVLGKTAKVAEYEELINVYMFPAKVNAYVAEDLYVKSDQVVELGKHGEIFDGVFGTITVEKGGQLRILGNGAIISQVFILK